MKQTIILFFLLVTGSAFSQDEIISFEPNQAVYVLGDSINIRKEPNTKSELVVQVPVGTKLTIIKRSNQTMNLNGFEMPWYLVQITPKQKGYIWGGKIAHYSFRSSKNPDIVFHFGLEKEIDGIATYQIRVEKNHKELQHITFEGFGSAMKRHTFTNYSNRGLTNVDDVIYVDGYSEACGDAGGAIVFFWSNGTLYNVRVLGDYSDVPVFSTETFIYPSDMEGKKDLIILLEQDGEYIFNEDDNAAAAYEAPEIKYSKNKRTAYRWDGKQLLEKKQ
jgi:hypothetical protein